MEHQDAQSSHTEDNFFDKLKYIEDLNFNVKTKSFHCAPYYAFQLVDSITETYYIDPSNQKFV